MAQVIQQYACRIPNGTPESSPVTVEMQLGVFEVGSVQLVIPDGFNGVVGFYIASSNLQVIPYWGGGPNTWIIGNSQTLNFPLDSQPDSGDWQLVGYNNGDFDHTVYVTWFLDPVQSNSGQSNAPTIEQLNS